MAAIVRQSMSRTLAKDLLTDMLGTTNEYYIGIGKSDPFNAGDTVIDPIDSPHDEREFFHSLQSIKKIEGATSVAKRVNWSSGSEYAGWSDAVNSDIVAPWTPWYVMNDAKEVYICLQHGTNLDGTTKQSVIEPNYTLLGIADYTVPFTTSDEYVWKFLYSLTPENIYQFLSSNHIPVQEALSLGEGDSIEDLQAYVKAAKINGQIISARVTSAGLGHAAAPVINVHGDGTGAVAVATVVGGEITRIIMTSYGSGYTYASFEIVDATATIIGSVSPVITPSPGLGFNPINDLKTSSILTNIKPDGTVSDTFITGSTFRQMGLIKNPKQTDGTTPFTGTSAKGLPSFTLDSTSPFEAEKLITGSQSGAQAHVDESAGSVVYYHQNTSTGFKPFIVGEAVTQVGNVLTGDIVTLSPMSAIDRFSGELLYLENRPRIRRDVEQQEDIKIVITV
jgi:hypothetical protein